MNVRPGLALLRHQRRLTSRFARRLGESDAEDLASEAIARGLARPAPDGRQEPWIETIFRNLLADAHRRRARAGRTDALVDELADRGGSPEDVLLRREQRRAVASALPAIPAELRQALVARFYDDQDYQRMAASSGISVTTARTRVWRALAHLRRCLDGLHAWWPVTFRSGTPLSAAWLPAATVAVLAIGPSIDVGAARVTAGAIIGDGESGAAPRMRVTSPRPVVTLAAATRKREAATSRPPATPHAATAVDESAPAEDSAKPVAVKHYDFDDDVVDGELQRPGIIIVTGSPRETKLGSLIEIPRSFWPSMAKMVEDNE